MLFFPLAATIAFCGLRGGARRRMAMQRARCPVPRCYVGGVADDAPMDAQIVVVGRMSAWRRATLRRGPVAQALAQRSRLGCCGGG